jgi:hypothetical protein
MNGRQHGTDERRCPVCDEMLPNRTDVVVGVVVALAIQLLVIFAVLG